MKTPVPILLLTAALSVGGQTPVQNRRPVALSDLSSSLQQIAERADLAVVQILTRGYDVAPEAGRPVVRARRGGGSGAIVDPSGYVVTNAHVVGSAQVIQIVLAQPSGGRFTPKQVPAEVVGLDRETDIAVLKADLKNAPALRFADSDGLRQGQIVLALGSPFGLSNSLSMGVVSSAFRELRADDPMLYIQTDASINPGNSGGPLLNTGGEIVGLNTMIATGSGGSDGIGFAVPSNVVRSVYGQIREFGRVRRGQIGVVAQTLTIDIAKAFAITHESGAILADVLPRGSAEGAGLKIGDLIVSANGKPVTNARQFGLAIYGHAGQTVEFGVIRAGNSTAVRVAVLERSRDPDRLLSLVSRPQSLVPALALIGVDLERALSLMPGARRLNGVVVAGTTPVHGDPDNALQAGDIIFSLNQTAVNNLNGLKQALSHYTHGQTVVLHIERMGQLQFLPVEIE